jgi:hypothetical protein
MTRDFKLDSVPYAPLSIVSVEGKPTLVATCPECGEPVVEPTDQFGETTANNYGQHYLVVHLNGGEV